MKSSVAAALWACASVARAQWAFGPLPPPSPGGSIDAFLETASAEPADALTLLRRVTYDLVGVPPSPEEIDAYLRDPAAERYARAVDRLLADPRHGERWARHWLDLARYAESDGFENDKVRPHAWRYRDTVIRSFNEDKPYDRFVMEQIAGDLLFPGEPDALVATGFLRLGPWDELCKNEAARRQDFLNDATDATGSVFLGLSVGCARCHDHKYDPITMADYYGLQAFFAGVKREAAALPPDGGLLGERCAREEARLEELKARKREIRERHKARAGDDEKAIQTSIDGDEADKKRWAELGREILLQEIEAAFWRPKAEAVVEGPPAVTRILKRGELDAPGEEVAPAFIKALGGSAARTRADLARLIASHPLADRVIVNRVWAHHFGSGIVETPSDFGANGSAPTHPKLLDWLAGEFVRGGRRLKPLHRLIVTSAAYRRGAGRSRRRLEAEALRDAILAAGGVLNPKRGGPGVYAKIPAEVQVDLPNNDKLPSWGAAPEDEGRRRTIYVFQRRSLSLPLVEAFDGADMNHPCPRRAVTTVATQALQLFNGEFARVGARAFAERVEREGGRDPVGHAWRIAYGRPPDEVERRLAAEFLARPAPLAELCHVLINSNEFVYVD